MYNPPANDAPGLPFVFGGQNGFLNQVEKNNWLVPISSIYTPYTTVHAQTLTLHATIEPIPDWKIEVSANRTYSMNTSQYVHDSAGRYVSNTYTEMGNFSMSYFALRTAFTGLFSSATTSPLFGNYLWYRSIISYRLAAQNPNSAGITGAYADGYSGISQNVVIPAFLAAYSGQNPNKITLNLYPQIPMPNWNMSYSGLSKLKWIKKHFQSVVISNAYSSAYTVGGFNYNLLFGTDAEGFPNVRDVNGDFLPRDQIPTVSISDQFSPLGKIAITFKNNVTSNIEVRTDRQIALNMSDLTVNEVHGTEYLVGAGYKIKNVTLPFKIGGKAIKNDMTIRADFSLRQNETIIRNTLDGSNQVTGGQGILSIKSQIEYMVNTRITIRLYFDKIINTPYISSSYPTSTMDGGLALRFSLS
jgi:cell surface protein SprA